MPGFAAALSRKKCGEIGTVLASPTLLISVATVLSISMQGFAFEFANDVFHVPIVLHFDKILQFAHDPFVQSLGKFVSPVYLLLSLVADEHNIELLFLLCHVVTRATTFLAFLMICTAAGVPEGWRRAAVVALLTSAHAIYGSSAAGDAGLLLPWFSHSELAQAMALIAIALMMRGKMLAAAVAVGLAFDLNAFVGVWMGVPLANVLLANFAVDPNPLRMQVLSRHNSWL